MKVWVEKIVTYDHLPVEKMHFHVRLVDEEARYHRSCEVVVFADHNDNRTLDELKAHAVHETGVFLREIVAALETGNFLPTPPPETAGAEDQNLH